MISTSGDHVNTGVALVDKAGQTLGEIMNSVGDIAEHVTGIASSTKDQSIGLDEINSAMSQLDQVTQRNVAMFEETMAATQTVQSEASLLVDVTGRFECSRDEGTSRRNMPRHSFESARNSASEAAGTARETVAAARPPVAAPERRADGNLALAEDPETAHDDNWEEF